MHWLHASIRRHYLNEARTSYIISRSFTLLELRYCIQEITNTLNKMLKKWFWLAVTVIILTLLGHTLCSYRTNLYQVQLVISIIIVFIYRIYPSACYKMSNSESKQYLSNLCGYFIISKFYKKSCHFYNSIIPTNFIT